MNTILFIARVTGDPAAGYTAVFPDIEDCTAHGRDLADLLTRARQALAAHLDALEGAGEAWPTPTPIEQITPPAPGSGALLIPIDVAVDDPPIRVNVSLGERLVQRLDAAAEERGMTRSGFIAQSVRASLGETAHGPNAYGPGGAYDPMAKRFSEELSTLGRRLNESLGPDSAFTRRMNEIDNVVYDGVRRAADSVAAAIARRQETTKPKPAPEPEPKPGATANL